MIRVETEGAVRRIVLGDPDRHNALGNADYIALAEALAVPGDIACIHLSAQGRSFCAGNRLDLFETEWPQGPNGPVVRFLRALVAAPVPVVAEVQGPAVGIGATMLLHCDVVLAAATAHLRYPFLPLGIAPEGGASRLLAARVGPLRAADILLTGRKIAAAEALVIGLCTETHDLENLAGTASAWVARLADTDLDGLRATKALARPGFDLIDLFDNEIAAIDALVAARRLKGESIG